MILTISLITRKNGQTYSNNLGIFTSQDFKNMYYHFSTLRRKSLSCNFQEYFKGIISIILFKTLTLRNVKKLQSKQSLLKVCSEIVFGKNWYHYRKPVDWSIYYTKSCFWEYYRKLQNIWEIRNAYLIHISAHSNKYGRSFHI